jgi:GGDEF domain-containing protein
MVLVVFLGPDPPEHHVTHACVVQIRGQLRPDDMAGTLSSGHIGVVLPDTPADGAGVVAERLRRLVTTDPGFGPFPQASVVFANSSSDLSAAESQLRDAYARVLGDVRLMPGSPN